MLIDGKALAEKIKTELKSEVSKLHKKIRLAVVKVGSDAVTEKFLEQKKKFAEAIGVDVRIYEVPADISTNKLREKVSEIVHIKENTGVIIQLPLPPQINAQYILDAIVLKKDPDMLSSKSRGLSPVVRAIEHIFKTYGVETKGKNIVVVGAGRLVGKPIATWLMNQGATVTVIDENTPDVSRFTLQADIIISGVGKPNIITPEMVKEGVVAIDCGTSSERESASLKPEMRSLGLAGDIDPGVSQKVSLFSPVPGGVGPLTVAFLFKNLVELSK